MKQNLLGTPVLLGADDASVRLTLHLAAQCNDSTEDPLSYEAVEGQIVFDSLYVPWVDDAKPSSGYFSNVVFADRNRPLTHYAIVSGEFSFDYDRGHPVQHFP
ncbi:MAG: hypothetical protein R3A47_08215 [Polyangiales bacterium]